MAIYVNTGIAGQIMMCQENGWGVLPTITTSTVSGQTSSGARMYEFKSDSLAGSKQTVQGQGLHGGGLYDRNRRRILATYSAAGAITMDLPTRQLGFLLRNMLGSFGQAGVSTAPTLITTSGLYRSVHQGPAGSQTVGGLFGQGVCIQKGVPAVDMATTSSPSAFTYLGGKFSDWEISCQIGAIAQLTLGVDAMAEIAGTSTNSINIPPAAGGTIPPLYTGWSPNYNPADTNLFFFRQGGVYFSTSAASTTTTDPVSGVSMTYVKSLSGVDGGSASQSSTNALGHVTNFSVKQTVALAASRYFFGTGGFKAEQLEDNFRNLTGALTIEWLSSEAIYQAYATDATVQLEFQFIGLNPNSNAPGDLEYLDIIIPGVRLNGSPPVINGPGIVTQNVTFDGLDDESTTPIQIAYQSMDSVY
jgi:hypothetical protein